MREGWSAPARGDVTAEEEEAEVAATVVAEETAVT